jgi:hypothetical protein
VFDDDDEMKFEERNWPSLYFSVTMFLNRNLEVDPTMKGFDIPPGVYNLDFQSGRPDCWAKI